MNNKGTVLLIVDPNNDFVDKKGSMYIKGADKVITSLSKFLATKADNIDSIYLTQDSHLKYNLNLKSFWQPGPNNEDSDISYPSDYDIITSEDVKSLKWIPRYHSILDIVDYLQKIEDKGLCHTIYPDHCIFGSWGWSLPDNLVNALNVWSNNHDGRGYSIMPRALRKERETEGLFSYRVPRKDNRPINLVSLLYTLLNYDKILICGVGKDKIIKETVEQMTNGSIVDISEVAGKLVFIDDFLISMDENSSEPEIYNIAVDRYDATRVKSKKL